MRAIPVALAEKVRDLQQTKGNDANPQLSAIISRHKVPITDYSMWQTGQIGAIDAVSVSVAASRPDPALRADRLYVAAIQTGSAVIYSSVFDGWRPPVAWSTIATIDDAVYAALAFEGIYTSLGRRVEFSTVGEPLVFWIDSAGDVYAKSVTDTGPGTLLAAETIAISAIMGPAGYGGSVSSGLVLACVTDTGSVLTRQYADGVWENGVLCSSAPANVVDIALSRTWDYRVAMTLKTSDGKVYLMTGKSMISGNANNAFIDVPEVELAVEVNKTIQNYTKAADENIEMADIGMSADVYSAVAPTLLSVANIDDGNGNWGLKLRLVYSGPVYDITGNASSFVLTAGSDFAGEAVEYDSADPEFKTLLLTLTDFNNRTPQCTLIYTPGTLASGPSVTLLDSQSVQFTATGLVPNAPPAVVSIAALSNTVIDIEFDSALSSADISANLAAIAVSGNEPLYSPDGGNVATDYIVSNVDFAPALEDSQDISLASGTLTDMEVV